MALTHDDLQALKDLMEITFKETAEDMELVTKDDINHLPNKDEFYEQTGEIIKRLDTMEKEKDVLSSQISNHEDRIEKIESHLHLPSD
jgi:hypothetical protein